MNLKSDNFSIVQKVKVNRSYFFKGSYFFINRNPISLCVCVRARARVCFLKRILNNFDIGI